ncbi:MAG: fasciclin domain-containing protein [Anaerolineae bacterium]|nr:fasciclin domain-containing protein [Anaerolineae bacterium]
MYVLLLAGLTVGTIKAQDQTIVDLAVATPELSTLVTAVQAAGLVDVLADPNAQWTVFAPTNEAFAALPEGVLDMLLADTELLTRVLTYHVVEGAITSDQLSDMMAPSMEMTAPGADLMGSELNVTVNDDGTVMINNANVIMADIIASNGVVHVIDAVLIPPSLVTGDLYVSTNPADLANDMIAGVAGDLTAVGSSFGNFTDIASVESVWFDGAGSAYATVDVTPETGAVYIYDGIVGSESMDAPAPTRMISGPTTGLAAPKGIVVLEELGYILVANNGAKNVTAFALDAEGDAAPAFVISDFGGVDTGVWDMDYNAETDQLYVAGTTGIVFVYDGFSMGMGATLTKQIIPTNTNGDKISVNLHGIEYDAATDTLLLTDVGAADNNTDGQIFTISGASTANDLAAVTLQIAGDQTMLGNPVDLAFDGTNLYVAEKANDLVLRYDNILSLTGTLNQPADLMLSVTKPESLAYAGGM